MSQLNPTDKLVRKLRKKLRQIERLELTGRHSLNADEISKVKQKQKIREQLAQLLKQEEDQNPKESAQSGDDSLPGVAANDSAHSNCDDTEKNKAITLSPVTAISPTIKSKEVVSTIEPQEIQSASSSPSKQTSVLPEVDDKMKRSSSPSTSTSGGAGASPSEGNRGTPPKMSKKQAMPGEAPPAPKTSAVKSSVLTAPKAWHETHSFLSKNLEAHSDLVSCVDMKDDYIISGSRDTLIQVWDAKTGVPLMNLRGHSNTVTCVQLLSTKESQELGALLAEPSTSRLALTASSDCCLKLWDIEKGTTLRSIYTYSGVTALCYLPAQQYCAIGSEGGKLEVYTLHGEEHTNPIFSVKTFEGPVTSIKLEGDQLFCSSMDGLISVWSFNGSELNRIYLSEDLNKNNLRIRPILGLTLNGDDKIFYGDDGSSIKALSWKTGKLTKLRNHVTEFGLTNAVFATNSHLLSSSVDVDTGNSAINIRSLPELDYLGTLMSLRGGETGRIVCLSASEDAASKSLIRIVAGGSRLTLLEATPKGAKRSKDKTICKARLVNGLNDPVVDSQDESDSSSSEEDSSSTPDDAVVDDASISNKNSSWCLIL